MSLEKKYIYVYIYLFIYLLQVLQDTEPLARRTPSSGTGTLSSGPATAIYVAKANSASARRSSKLNLYIKDTQIIIHLRLFHYFRQFLDSLVGVYRLLDGAAKSVEGRTRMGTCDISQS